MNILDPKFKYVPAAQTDIRKTIAREYKRLAEQKRIEQENEQDRILKVRTIGRVK